MTWVGFFLRNRKQFRSLLEIGKTTPIWDPIPNWPTMPENIIAWFEVEQHSRMDLLRGIGFMVTLQMAAAWENNQQTCEPGLWGAFWVFAELRRVLPHGLLWMGIPCSSWIFLLGPQYTTPLFCGNATFLGWAYPHMQNENIKRNVELFHAHQLLLSYRSRGSTHRGWFRSRGLGVRLCILFHCHCSLNRVNPYEGNLRFVNVCRQNKLARRVGYLRGPHWMCLMWSSEVITNMIHISRHQSIAWSTEDVLCVQEEHPVCIGEPSQQFGVEVPKPQRNFSSTGLLLDVVGIYLQESENDCECHCAYMAKKLLRKHNAKFVTVSLGQLGSYTQKQVAHLQSCNIYIYVFLFIYISMYIHAWLLLCLHMCPWFFLGTLHALSLSKFWRLKVKLVGTARWLKELGAPLTPLRKQQLKRIKSFLKLQTVRVYTSSSGVRRCVGAP